MLIEFIPRLSLVQGIGRPLRLYGQIFASTSHGSVELPRVLKGSVALNSAPRYATKRAFSCSGAGNGVAFFAAEERGKAKCGRLSRGVTLVTDFAAISSNRSANPASALRDCRTAFIGVGVTSALVNILYLTGSFFMLEVYDRVLPSRSIPSLIALCLLALLLYGFQGIFELIRNRMLVRIAGALDESLSGRIYRALVKAPLNLKTRGDSLQGLRDFDQVRSYLSGTGPSALFDLPGLPFYVVICFLFHPIIEMVAVGGGLILTFLNSRQTCRLPASGCRAVRRNRCREHRSL